VTKLPALPAGHPSPEDWVRDEVTASLRRLGLKRLYAVLLHRPGQLLEGQGQHLFEGLRRVKNAGLVEKIGVSIYDPEELAPICALYPIDIVQAPVSVVDRRMVDSGWMTRLAADGIELHARSVFLQGLLLMSAAERPAKFSRWGRLWAAWETWLAREGVTGVQACLRHVLSFPEIAKIVVGVDSEVHLAEILDAVAGTPLAAPLELSSSDTDLINPSRWSSL